MKSIFSRCFITLFLLLFQCNSCLAWTVSPVRFEVKGEKGKEYTLTFSVLNESQLHQKRFDIQTDDWIINKKNDFLRKAFNKDEVNNKYSATPWIKVTPQQFVVPPGETKKIRFTISIPNDLPASGEYTSGIFVGEKNIEKPPKGEKIIHIKQDTFIGVVVYIRIGEQKIEVNLKDLKIEAKPVSKGLSKVTILPAFESTGNVHARAQLLVKMEPLSNFELKKAETKLIDGSINNIALKSAEPIPDTNHEIPKEFSGGELVVLRESELTFPIDVPVSLPANSNWKFTVKADFGGTTPLLVGTKKYTVPDIQITKTGERNKVPERKQEPTPLKK